MASTAAGAESNDAQTDRADPPHHMEARHRRFVATEAMLGSLFSGLVPACLIWLLRAPVPAPLLGGSHSLAFSLIPGTLGPAATVPIVITYVVRRRVRKGGAPALGWPLIPLGLAGRLPDPVVLRGLLCAVAAVLIVPPFGLLLMMMLGVTTLSPTGFILYNLAHGMAMGALILPPVVKRALADGPRASGRTSRAGS